MPVLALLVSTLVAIEIPLKTGLYPRLGKAPDPAGYSQAFCAVEVTDFLLRHDIAGWASPRR